RIHAGNVLLNLVVGLTILGGIAGGTEWWVATRGGILRFRMIDLLAGVTILALLLGWRTYHIRTERLDQKIAGELGLTENLPRRSTHRYSGHVWLEKLAGNADLLPEFLFHRTLGSMYEPLRDPQHAHKVTELRYVNRIDFHSA